MSSEHLSSPPISEITPQPESSVTDEQIEACLEGADSLKQEGNDLFRAGKWEQALSTYRSALGRLPKHPSTSSTSSPTRDVATEEIDPADSSDPEVETSTPNAAQEEPGPRQPPGKWDRECAKSRAVLNANIAACYVKIGDHKEVVQACSEALKDNPVYVKALTRRAASNEVLDTWSSLTSAQEDYEKLLTLSPPSDVGKIRAALNKVKPRAEAAQKREMSEMMGKLKGIGNSILGNFGLSTDNFKFEPNGQGGYSINFSQ